jgi:hypothetical protein
MVEKKEADVIMRRGRKLAVLNKAGESRNAIVEFCMAEFAKHAKKNFSRVLDRLVEDKPEHYIKIFQSLVRNETMTETMDKEEIKKNTQVLVTFDGGKKFGG